MWPRLRELRGFELRGLGVPKTIAEQILFFNARGLKGLKESTNGEKIFKKINSPFGEVPDKILQCLSFSRDVCRRCFKRNGTNGNGIAK